MNCELCREGMATGGLLNKLRCAECRQLTFKHNCDVALNVGLAVGLGALLLCLFARAGSNGLSLSSGAAASRADVETAAR
jgi:hypothetical protein